VGQAIRGNRGDATRDCPHHRLPVLRDGQFLSTVAVMQSYDSREGPAYPQEAVATGRTRDEAIRSVLLGWLDVDDPVS